jgi:hypothetical protein
MGLMQLRIAGKPFGRQRRPLAFRATRREHVSKSADCRVPYVYSSPRSRPGGRPRFDIVDACCASGTLANQTPRNADFDPKGKVLERVGISTRIFCVIWRSQVSPHHRTNKAIAGDRL